MALFPPMVESTMASREVGICTMHTLRMLESIRCRGGEAGHAQSSSNEANGIADNASTECEKDDVPGALLHYEKVLDGGLSPA